jgi:hypothetical protein
MERAFQLLRPGGTFHFIANLYRGPSASHRVKEVHFPWPHLLFTDDTMERYYASLGRKPKRSAWVNRMTAGDYQVLFREVGFEVDSLDYITKPIDEDLYRRFEDILGRYPRRDLERNFIEAVLRRPAPGAG